MPTENVAHPSRYFNTSILTSTYFTCLLPTYCSPSCGIQRRVYTASDLSPACHYRQHYRTYRCHLHTHCDVFTHSIHSIRTIRTSCTICFQPRKLATYSLPTHLDVDSFVLSHIFFLFLALALAAPNGVTRRLVSRSRARIRNEPATQDIPRSRPVNR